MKLKNYLLLLLLSNLDAHISNLYAQFLFKAEIRDAGNQEPLSGAIARLLTDHQIYAISNQEGYLELQLPQSDSLQLYISYTGYENQILSIVPALESTDAPRQIMLKESYVLLNTMVISASRSEKPLAESAISMDIIKPDYPEKLNSTSAQQVLDRIPGVQIIDGQANIRGGSGYSYGAGSRVMLVMDDLPILQPDAGFPNWDDLPLENVGQIEVVKGAASSLYGSAAMNGIIHFRNIRPTTEGYTALSLIPKFYFQPENGNHWWGKGNNVTPGELISTFVHRKRYHKTDLSLGLYYGNKTGYNKGNNSENFRANGIVSRHLNDQLLLTLGFNMNTGSSSSFFYWDAEGSFVGDSTSYSSSDKLRFTIDPGLQYISKSEYKHRLITRWYYVDNQNDNNQANQSDNLYSEYQLSKNLRSIGLEFTAGASCNYAHVDAKLYSESDFKSVNSSVYLQVEKRLLQKILLSGGVRYESFVLHGPDQIQNQTIENPARESKPVYRCGINYNVFTGTYLRASWGQGFRFPTIAEKFVMTNAGGVNVIPNPLLQPEYGNNAECGIKMGYKLGPVQGLIDLAAFWSRYQNMMEFTLVFKDFRFLFQSQNVGDTEIKGLEISNQAKIGLGKSKIVISGGYTLLDPKFAEWDISGKDIPINKLDQATQAQRNAFSSTSAENILKYRSKHLARCDVEFQYRKMYAGVNFNYASHVKAVDWLFEVDLFIRGAKDFRIHHDHGYRVYDFRVGYDFGKIQWQLNLANAFNETYSYRPGLMEAPANLSSRLVWRI